jgi:hypothetical protein
MRLNFKQSIDKLSEFTGSTIKDNCYPFCSKPNYPQEKLQNRTKA